MSTSLIVMAGWIAACSDGPSLQYPADPGSRAAAAFSNVAPDQPLSFGSVMVCVSAPTTATLTSVSIHGVAGDIRVEAFGVRSNRMPDRYALGGEDSTLAAYGSGFVPDAPQEVSGVCPKDVLAPTPEEGAALSELGVQVRLASGEIAGGDNLDVTYRIDGRERTLTIPFGVWLCASECPPGTGSATMPPG